MRTCRVCILFMLTLFLLGCDEAAPLGPGPWEGDPPDLPAGAPEPNCVAPGHRIPYRAPVEEDEVVVIARCTEIRQYAKTRKGQWEYWWYVVAFDVMRVERGVWPHRSVVFCCYDTWPTPGSGIEVKKAQFPFVVAEGRVMALALQAQAEPPLVVGQEWRSRVPPHGRPRPLSFSLQSEEGKRLYDRLWAAVRTFAEQNGWPQVTGASHFEETADAYVLEVLFRADGAPRRAVAVDKETFTVREVP